MGYTGFSAKIFLAPFSAQMTPMGTAGRGSGHTEGQNCSWGKLNHVCDFLQEIVSSYSVTCWLRGFGP